MTTIETVLVRVPGLDRAALENWIARDWVRPDLRDGDYVFADIDIARIHLIHELHDTMAIDETALPVVLSLLDQLYDARRRLLEISKG